MITQESIEKLNQRIDIVDIISNFIEVKKQGSSYVCVCPFHGDKNPSMHINSQKGFYHCFACKAGGDAIKFVMEYEKLNFTEAVEKIASLSNFTLHYTKNKQENKKELKHILPLLNAFYKSNLSQYPNILKYLYERKLNDADIKKFELGYAPNNEESLRLLKNENIDFKDAISVGAIKKDERNFKAEYYASLIQRISFPIYDHKNLLVGFGGRTLDPNNPAKYINSPQNILFDKSRIFYAFHLAKDHIAQKKEIIICEGYMDAIAFHKAGFNNAVAVLGTALTENHIPLLRRYEAKAILCFDADNAGRSAATRSAFLLSTHKIDGKVVFIEGGKDPAELVAKGQVNFLNEILNKGMELGEFYIRELLKDPINSALDKQKALEKIQKYTFLLEPLIANSYTSLVAQLLKVEEKFISLSKNKKTNTFTSYFHTPYKEKKNLVEFEIFNYLKKVENAKNLFEQITDKACFKHKELLEKIFQGLGIEDSAIREFENENFNTPKNEIDFLLCILNVNLAFLNGIRINSTSISYKKQIFTLIQKNIKKLEKVLNSEDFHSFLKEKLIMLKQEKNETILFSELKTLNLAFNKNQFDLLTTSEDYF